ncbi:MAG: anaerobic ribonucleoside-triphosphate reductase activating protein [Bacteroidales bacterium]|nr:anaerobic ribonucleoside-triphosphate reductase activating protein [Bacteroidales bacterium]
MLKFYNYDIVFAEIPDEVSLAINITNCPNRCKGCHSLWLWKDIGEPLTEESLTLIVNEYLENITCVCFMGGDNSPKEVNVLAEFVKKKFNKKTAWYSGKEEISTEVSLLNFDYIKTGAYKEECGPLKEKTTNQRLYKIEGGKIAGDLTYRFWKK